MSRSISESLPEIPSFCETGLPVNVGDIDNLEIHFFFPFCLTSNDFSFTNETEPSDVARLFGNDGHLTFDGLEKTMELPKLKGSSLESDRMKNRAEDELLVLTYPEYTESFEPECSQQSRPPTLQLSLEDKYGNTYKLDQVFIRLFRFNVGILRFAITLRPRQKVRLQAVLDVQNGVMRLKDPKKAGRLWMADGSGDFLPKEFVCRILKSHFAESWKPDLSTDRLFTFTIAAISNVKSEDIALVAYKIATMEWDAESKVKKSIVKDFVEKSVDDKFVHQNGGLWSCFHPDAGSVLVFNWKNSYKNPDFSTLKLWGYERLENQEMSVFGSSWPFVSFSLAEPILFERMYLRNLDEQLRECVKKANGNNRKRLQDLYRELLEFRADFLCKSFSSTRGGRDQFDLWFKLSGNDKLMVNLFDSVEKLSQFYVEEKQRKTHKLLEAISILIFFFGFSPMINDIYWAYRNFTPSNNPDHWNWISPAIISGILFILGITFFVVRISAT